MGFQLTIAEGREVGREFFFDQDSVLIGRNSDCDVALYDQGISRRHCRILSERGQYYVEDQGSSNGTKVNGALVKKQALRDGDKLTLGPVVFAFAVVADEALPEESPAEGGDASTRIVSLDAVKRQRSRNKGVALVPEGAEPEELARTEKATTSAIPAVRPRRGAAASAALERPSTGGVPTRRASPSAKVERASAAGAGGAGLSAAERARLKRESTGPLGRVKVFWVQASVNVRRAIMGVGVLAVLGLFGVAYSVLMGDGDRRVFRGPEPETLGGYPVEDSFGLGEGVKWERPDMKVFDWEYTAATRALAILHYQATGISEGEVVVTVNGVDVGKVPADTLASQDRMVELVIPPDLLKKGEPNRIVFDNTKNPPGEDPWKIWNVWVEKALLPEMPPEQLLSEARTAYKRGRQNMETAEVGARNRYEAWKGFREAWLLMEAHPDPKPDLYYDARDKMRDAQQELDRMCSKLMLEVERYATQENWQAAFATLDHVRQYFPDENDQMCARVAENKRISLER